MKPTGNRRAARKDANDASLAFYARTRWRWDIIFQPPGCGCDWVALLPNGRVEIVEIKNPLVPRNDQKLTQQEIQLMEACKIRGIPYRVVFFKEQIDSIQGEEA